MSVRLVLADDHPLMLDGLEALFRSAGDFEVVARCRDGAEALHARRGRTQWGIGIPATTLMRFWTILAHYHGQTWNAAEPAREVEWLSEVEDFVENRFDADQVPHRVLDTGLRVEVENALGRDLFQLCANRAQRFADFSGEKGAELSDGRLPFLFSDHRFRRDERG